MSGALGLGYASVGLLRDEPDEALMARYVRGETRAFEVLFARHRRGVYNFLRRHAGEAGAEDLLQEVFLRVVRNADGFRGAARFTTWLYTIARNLAADALRRGRHRRAEPLDARDARNGADGAPREVADPRADVERDATSRDLGRRLEAAIRALPDELREVFLLRERAGLAFKEIAEAVGCPENTAKSRMRYALERLREELREEDMREGEQWTAAT